MNSLRRIATLPGLRAVLLRPGVRRRVASVLALRFQVAALSTTTPGRVVAGEVFSRGRVHTCRVRHTGVPVALQHGRDMEALFELFVGASTSPVPALRDRLSRDTVQRSSTSGPTSGCSRRGRAGAGRGRASSRWSRPRRTSSCCTSRPALTAGPKSSRPRSGRPTVRWGSSRAGVPVGTCRPSRRSATSVVRPSTGSRCSPTADFVKMDIEGGEWPILGDPRLRDLERLTLVMEYHRVGAPRPFPPVPRPRGLLEASGIRRSGTTLPTTGATARSGPGRADPGPVGKDASGRQGRARPRSPEQGEPRQHLVAGPVAALARQVRRDDGDLGRDPRRAGIRLRAPAPTGWRPAARGNRPRVRCGTNGPPSGAAPATEQADRTAARQPAPAPTPASTACTGEPRPEHLRPGDVREAPAARDRQRDRRGSAPATRRHPVDDVLDDPVRRRPHERQGQVPLVRRRPPQLRTRRPAHGEELVEVLDGILGGFERTRTAAWRTSSAAPRGMAGRPAQCR